MSDDRELEFVVARDDLHRCAVRELVNDTPLTEGEVELRVDRFALTANNITYGAFGDQLSYWQFFPTGDAWGTIPVWGYATVTRSRHIDIEIGRRYFGYVPPATRMRVAPARVHPSGFSDGVQHRAGLHRLYNQYVDTSNDPLYAAATQNHQLVLRPLFITSFVLDDMFAENAAFGARAILVSSASSKTAYGFAFLQSRRAEATGRARLIGSTSRANLEFVRQLGTYDDVIAYDDLDSLDVSARTAYLDFAGNARLRAGVRAQLGERFAHECLVGALHHDRLDTDSVSFFSPDQIALRVGELGRDEFAARFGAAWHAFLEFTIARGDDLVRIVFENGPAAVERVYRELLENRSSARDGHVLSLSGEAS